MHVECTWKRGYQASGVPGEHPKRQSFLRALQFVWKKKQYFCARDLLFSSIQEDFVNISGKLRNFQFSRESPGFTQLMMGRIAKCVCISRSLYHTSVAKPWQQSFRMEFQRFSQVRYNFWTAQLIYSRYFMRAKELNLRITVSLLISYASQFIAFVIKKSVSTTGFFSEKFFA